MRVSTNATAERKLFSSGRMLDVKGTLLALELLGSGSGRASRKVAFRDICHALKVIVTSVTEVRRSEAEEDCNRAAIPALVFKKVSSVFGTHLGARDVRATAAH